VKLKENLNLLPTEQEMIRAKMRWMRMFKILSRMASCYYPSWTFAQCTRSYTLLEMLDIVSFCLTVEVFRSY